MKKVIYTLRIGIIGNLDYHQVVFLDNLKKIAIDSKISKENSEFSIIYEQIPIKIIIFSAKSLEEITNNFNKIKKLDVIILTINLADKNSIYQYYKNIIDEFNEIYFFQGISILVGIDSTRIFKNTVKRNSRISRYSLKDMAKYLNLIYCYEIYNNKGDVEEIYRKILNDFLFRFRYSSAELFKQAKIYGESLLKGESKNFRSL